MRFGNNNASVGQQVFAMRTLFPQFKYRRLLHQWIGTLQPTDESPEYTIKIVYVYPERPKVWVTSPTLVPDACHQYPDKSLCLYYPSDGDWNHKKLLAYTIVPWTAEWLMFYEVWLLTGNWYGPEAPHNGTK